MKYLKFFLGSLMAVIYGYLRYNTEGYWFAIPLSILCIILGTD